MGRERYRLLATNIRYVHHDETPKFERFVTSLLQNGIRTMIEVEYPYFKLMNMRGRNRMLGG